MAAQLVLGFHCDVLLFMKGGPLRMLIRWCETPCAQVGHSFALPRSLTPPNSLRCEINCRLCDFLHPYLHRVPSICLLSSQRNGQNGIPERRNTGVVDWVAETTAVGRYFVVGICGSNNPLYSWLIQSRAVHSIRSASFMSASNPSSSSESSSSPLMMSTTITAPSLSRSN